MKTKTIDLLQQLERDIKEIEITKIETLIKKMETTVLYLNAGTFGQSFERESEEIDKLLKKMKRQVRKMKMRYTLSTMS